MANELTNLTNSINTLIQGQLILVNQNIAQVLRCVASSEVLRQTLADTLKNTSYATEFSRARVSWTRNDGVVVSQLKLPQDRNRLFSFVVCLLTEMDSGRRNFIDFLREYYMDESNNASYERFGNEVLKPFRNAVQAILGSAEPVLNPERVSIAERFYSAEKINIEVATITAILGVMDDIKVALKAEKMSSVEKIETERVFDYLVNALYLKNPKILDVSWIAFRCALNKYQSALYLLDKMRYYMDQLVK